MRVPTRGFRSVRRRAIGPGALVLGLMAVPILSIGSGVGSSASASPAVPRLDHIVVTYMENEDATATFEDPTAAPHLAQLRKEGAYIPAYYAVGHASLDNYLAIFSGEQPIPSTEADCLGMPPSSCTFPATVPTLATTLTRAGLSWKVYSEGMDGAPGGHNCLHSPSESTPDPYQGPGTNGYTTRHNPAPWFDSILDQGTDQSYCQAHSVDLTQLWKDDQSPSTLPTWSFVEPDTCHDGHDDQTGTHGGCSGDPEGPEAPSGIAAIDAWLPGFVQRLTTSPAWDSHSLLIITFDEGATTDTSGCGPCHDGSAGGRIGALLIGAPVKAGFVSSWTGDHYAMLRTIEDSLGLPTLEGLAVTPAAANTVHDGDPGITPLTDVWSAAAYAPVRRSVTITTDRSSGSGSPVASGSADSGTRPRGSSGGSLGGSTSSGSGAGSSAAGSAGENGGPATLAPPPFKVAVGPGRPGHPDRHLNWWWTGLGIGLLVAAVLGVAVIERERRAGWP